MSLRRKPRNTQGLPQGNEHLPLAKKAKREAKDGD
jgi:hypothetical protein